MSERCCCQSSIITGSNALNKSFPKKLLVAISIVVFISICVAPSEARSVPKMRHQRNAATKEISNMPNYIGDQRTRHQKRLEDPSINKTAIVKKTKNPRAEVFARQTCKIFKKLKNTRTNFKQIKRNLTEYSVYQSGKPEWLPKVNFVKIHESRFYTESRKSYSKVERKFRYLMPKLLKSLRQYEAIFIKLQSLRIRAIDESFDLYLHRRQDIIMQILVGIQSTAAEVEESYMFVNLEAPKIDLSTMNLNSLSRAKDATYFIKQDAIAFRGYGNLLNNWYMQLRCAKRNNKGKKMCLSYEELIQRKLKGRHTG